MIMKSYHIWIKATAVTHADTQLSHTHWCDYYNTYTHRYTTLTQTLVGTIMTLSRWITSVLPELTLVVAAGVLHITSHWFLSQYLWNNTIFRFWKAFVIFSMVILQHSLSWPGHKCRISFIEKLGKKMAVSFTEFWHIAQCDTS